MSTEMVMSPLLSAAMEMIMNAGDARLYVKHALDAVEVFDFPEAKAQMALAKENWVKAHHAQTDIIQNEAAGNAYEYSILFTHAQDTLMTINSEMILAEQLIHMFQALDGRYVIKGQEAKP